MHRQLAAILTLVFASLPVFSAPRTQGQEGDASRAGDLDQVQWCREGIQDPTARPEVRRRWASRLVLLGTTESKAAVVELLSKKDVPDSQRALADALTEHARTDRMLLDDSFIQPLIDLLGHANVELRAAAARAIAEFPRSDIPKKLGALIGDPQTLPVKRMAAIDALAPNVHRRDVIEELIALLDRNLPEVNSRVMTVLQPIAREPCGQDATCWRGWWANESRLKEEERLTVQLQLYRDRAIGAQKDLDALRDSTKRHEAALGARVLDLLRNEYRQLPVEQRDAKVVEWLKEPLNDVVLGAIEIVKSRLADEGQRPDAAIRDALLQVLKDGAPVVRREALQILQNLNDPEVVQVLLARVESEDDVATRAGLYRALGKLATIDAIPFLVHEITDRTHCTECAREAALALGLIAAKPEAKSLLSSAVEPLRARYYATSFDDSALKSALLSAMAGVADESFRLIFLDALESNDAAILRPAIRGLRALADVSKLARLRTLTSDKDPLVRRAATEAIGVLARDDTDFESLIPRLNPAIEPSDVVRQAAWTGFLEWQKRRPLAERIKAAERLRDMPDLELRYLVDVSNDIETTEGARSELVALHERLANTFISQGKFAAAMPHLKEMYGYQLANDPPSAVDVGVRWLEAMLRCSNPGELSELLNKLLADAKTDEAKKKIAGTVIDFVSSLDYAADPDRARKLQADIPVVQSDGLGERWTAMVQVLNDKAGKTSNGNSNSSN